MDNTGINRGLKNSSTAALNVRLNFFKLIIGAMECEPIINNKLQNNHTLTGIRPYSLLPVKKKGIRDVIQIHKCNANYIYTSNMKIRYEYNGQAFIGLHPIQMRTYELLIEYF